MARLDAEIAAGAVPPAPLAGTPVSGAAPESQPAEPAATAAPKRRRNPRT